MPTTEAGLHKAALPFCAADTVKFTYDTYTIKTCEQGARGYNGDMPTVSLSLGDRSYQVHVANGALDAVGYLAERLRISGKAAIITDSNVNPLYANRLMKSLQDADYSYSLHVFEAGEQSKNLSTVESLAEEMVAAGHDRSSFFIAFSPSLEQVRPLTKAGWT